MLLRKLGTFLWRTVYIQAVRRHYVYTMLELLYVGLIMSGVKDTELLGKLNAEPEEWRADDLMPSPPQQVVFGPNTSYHERLLRTMVGDLEALQPKPDFSQRKSSRACVGKFLIGKLAKFYAVADTEEGQDTIYKAVNRTDVLRTCSLAGYKPWILCVAFYQEPGTLLPSLKYTLFLSNQQPGSEFQSIARDETRRLQRAYPLGASKPVDFVLDAAAKFQYAIDRTHVNLQHEAFRSKEELPNVTIQSMPPVNISDPRLWFSYRPTVPIALFFAFLVPLVRRINAIEQEFSSGLADYQSVMGLSEIEFFLGHFFTSMVFAMTEGAISIAAMYTDSQQQAALAHDVDPIVLVTSFTLFHIGHTLLVTLAAWIFPRGWIGLILGVLVYVTAEASIFEFPSVATYFLHPRRKKLLTGIFPVPALSSVLRILLLARDYEGSAGWETVGRRVLGLDNVTIAEIWAVMALSNLAILFLTWYLSRVLPWVSDRHQSPFFLFMPSYWRPESRGVVNVTPLPRQPDRFEDIPSDVPQIVVAQNVTKSSTIHVASKVITMTGNLYGTTGHRHTSETHSDLLEDHYLRSPGSPLRAARVPEILAVKARFSSPHIDLAEMEELCKNIINEEVAQREAFDKHTEVGRRMTDLLVDVNDDSDILGEVGQETAVQQAQLESAQAAAARCPAVQMRKDIMPTDVYLHRMRMMNAGQFEIVREVIHRLTTPDSELLQVFFTGAAGCGKTFVLRIIMDVYNRYFRSGNRDVFGSKCVLRGLDLRIYQSRVTVLLGQNGAGKTTLLSILTGTLSPTSGLVKVLGLNVSTHRDDVRKVVSFCYQTEVLFKDLTCFENLAYFGSLKGVNREVLAQEVYSAMETVDLTDRENSMPGELSGGMMRRLSVAIALLGKPKLLILDEPTTGLDPETRRNVWGAVRRAANNTTVLLSTHSMGEADAIADQIVVMADGRVICSGSKAFLNKACGVGYKLTIVKAPDQFDRNGVLSTVKKAAPTAGVDVETLDEVSIALGTLDHKDFPDVFETLEKSAEKFGIRSMGVTAASLMDVYIKITTDWTPGGKRDVGAVQDQHMANICLPIEKQQTFLRSSRALIVKRFVCLTRSWGQLTLTFVAPIFILLLIMSLVESPTNKWYQRAQVISSGNKLDPDGGVAESEMRLSEQFPGAPVFIQEAPKRSGNASHHFRVLVESEGGSIRSGRDIKSDLSEIAAEDFSLYMRTYPLAVAFEEGIVRGIYNPTSPATLPVLFNLLHTAQLRASTGHSEARIYTTLASPEEREDKNQHLDLIPKSIVLAHWALYLAFSYTVLFASFVVYPVDERLSGARQMQLMTGISGCAFIMSHFLFDFACYVLVVAVWCLVHFMFSWHSFSTAITFYISFVSFAPAAILYAYLNAERVESVGRGIASVIQWVYVNGLIFSFVYEVVDTAEVTISHPVWILFPPFGIVISLAKISIFDINTQYCKSDRHTKLRDMEEAICATSTPFTFSHEGIGYEVVYSFVQAVFFFAWASFLASGYIFVWREAASMPTEESVSDQNVEEEKQLVTKLRDNGQFAAHALVAWNLHKSYDTRHAVRGVYLALRPSECFGLLGVNGAGKTSTFQMLAGLSTVSYGEAYTPRGALTKNPRQWQSCIGYCSQAETLLDNMNAYEHLLLIGRLRGIPEEDLKVIVDNMLAVFDLKENAAEKSGVYSGGTRRKLVTAMTLLGQPPLIFLDEPFTGVDAVSRSVITRFIGVVRKKTQASFIITSHNMEVCESACDRITIMVAGRMMCLGTLQQLKDRYGKGHRIEFSLREADEEKSRLFTEAVDRHFPGIRLATVNEGIFVFHLVERVPWSALFRKVVQLEKDFELSNVIVGDYTLEQIFFAFANSGQHFGRPVQAVMSLVSRVAAPTAASGYKNKPKI